MGLRNKMPLWKKNRAREMRRNPTRSERVFWNLVRNKQTGYGFKRQAPILGYIADFWCPRLRLVIEIDGVYHDNSEQIKRDNIRDEALRSHGISTLRIPSTMVTRKLAIAAHSLLDIIEVISGGRVNKTVNNCKFIIAAQGSAYKFVNTTVNNRIASTATGSF